jgi:hypothetical protein
VRVPETANLGKAKVTFSFDAWKEGRVASSTWGYSVVKPEEKPVNQKTAPGTTSGQK